MIEHLDQKTKDRVNHAISNVRLLATRVKRANLLDASQRAEIVVNLLNEFRMYVNVSQLMVGVAGVDTSFKHDRETLERVAQAAFQADDIYNKMSLTNKKKYDEEYRQVWFVLENIHAYLERILLGKV